ncbi:2-hydroxy-3-oxopropionate reductase [Enterovibrio norvegicus]|uniref:2-hydroxy-3-oxopropionate reductase n=1 Tax=Enterovibrio norvegicus DSM 15893 TaxID=1121869 RepID=A0A1I5LNK9_9GAMM|nr:2-hydroxy-3-oxopropionate reductase [Enterovibrio norvegicus]MCC4798577.1 2-hydroxy-3-oxopropionate reductase [Enterovibrio norvegicus]PMH67764.1 2-hydroxy-3-oxopropionate reductase [Enterovibrio norvegicus]PMI36989.1 2-hydroxy-3-oxopropionate reductase [Enterovibrio norvegicus]PMN49499.1 2-hydroxy-3-oxopropionate reductase [Enterovibrio norvegicus]SFO98898.1 2-hydroxy-3-oxopropionate reductase [Enterovibrio norvegicus DSM 15893]
MSTIAFIGTGIMGKPMAKNLQKSGYQLHLSEARSPAPTSLVDGGAKRFPSNRLAVEHADFVIIMVPDTPQVKDVLFGDDGIDAMLAAGKTVIDMSSISPIETRQFAERVKALGADYLDAPVSGGEVGAINAALTIMVGGAPDTFDSALPLFGAMGKNINLVGDCGAGQVCKVANQIIVALNIEAVSEALVFASKAGADPARIREALLGGFANSKVLEVHGERMVQGTFDPGFRIALHQKDLNLALTGAASLGVALPNTQKAQELFEICAEQGGASWDHSAMVKAIETLSNHSIR